MVKLGYVCTVRLLILFHYVTLKRSGSRFGADCSEAREASGASAFFVRGC